MNEWLAQYFGTAPVSEETEKQASAELFVKLAQENGIDLDAMSEGEVQELYESTMGKVAEDDKVAEFPPKKDDDEDDEKKKKVEAASKEHEEKKESAAKFAEAVFMGQTMAHAMMAELDKIAEVKEAGVKDTAKAGVEKTKDFFSHVGHSIGKGAKTVASKVPGAGEISEGREELKRLGKIKTLDKLPTDKMDRALAHKRIALGGFKAGATVGGGAAAVGAGAAAAHHFTKDKEKKSSALDELAAELAAEKVAASGWNQEEAVDRISAILTLGVDDENSKVAFTQTLDEAVEVRSLELAEAAGYPVNWPTE